MRCLRQDYGPGQRKFEERSRRARERVNETGAAPPARLASNAGRRREWFSQDVTGLQRPRGSTALPRQLRRFAAIRPRSGHHPAVSEARL